jgi:hypothetical protein
MPCCPGLHSSFMETNAARPYLMITLASIIQLIQAVQGMGLRLCAGPQQVQATGIGIPNSIRRAANHVAWQVVSYRR